jgi:hypothetical protein
MEFITNVERFVELHKNIAAAQKAMKDSKKEKTILGKQILEYMMTHHMATHEVDGFTVVNKETEVKGKLSLEMIEAMLENLIGDTVTQDYVDKILSALMNQETTGDVKNTLVIKKLKEPKEPKQKKGKKTADDDDE